MSFGVAGLPPVLSTLIPKQGRSISWHSHQLVALVGFEPTTCGFRDRCTAVVLQGIKIAGACFCGILSSGPVMHSGHSTGPKMEPNTGVEPVCGPYQGPQLPGSRPANWWSRWESNPSAVSLQGRPEPQLVLPHSQSAVRIRTGVDGGATSNTMSAAEVGSPGGIRTLTGWLLRPLPLPVGLRDHEVELRTGIEPVSADYKSAASPAMLTEQR